MNYMNCMRCDEIYSEKLIQRGAAIITQIKASCFTMSQIANIFIYTNVILTTGSKYTSILSLGRMKDLTDLSINRVLY